MATVYVDNFRQNGLCASQADAREIAENLEIDRTFPEQKTEENNPAVHV